MPIECVARDEYAAGMNLILLIVVLFLMFGGGGFHFGGHAFAKRRLW